MKEMMRNAAATVAGAAAMGVVSWGILWAISGLVTVLGLA